MAIGGHMGIAAMKKRQLKDAKATLSAVVDRAVTQARKATPRP